LPRQRHEIKRGYCCFAHHAKRSNRFARPKGWGHEVSHGRARVQGLRSSGETVVIDGLCASACTIVLNAVPHDKICVTSRATLGFHAAWNFGAKGRTITDREATLMLYSMYPMPVQRWIAARGGLTPHMIFLRGKVLQAMYKPCYIDAHYAGF
jgi:hypothetical protein